MRHETTIEPEGGWLWGAWNNWRMQCSCGHVEHRIHRSDAEAAANRHKELVK